ncbi:MAG TPA: hypothetical protein VIG40_02355, partial [Tissierellaceae bacterium]
MIFPVKKIFFLKEYIFIAFFVLFVAILIEFNLVGGLWDKFYDRHRSFIFDPNYAAAILGLGASFCLINIHSSKVYTIMFVLLSFGVLLTNSRGIGIALIFVFIMRLLLYRKWS